MIFYMIFNTNNALHILKWTNYFARDNSIFDSLFFGIFKGGIRCKEMPNMLTFLKNELLLYHGMSFGSISNPKLERRKDNYSFSKSNFLHFMFLKGDENFSWSLVIYWCCQILTRSHCCQVRINNKIQKSKAIFTLALICTNTNEWQLS